MREIPRATTKVTSTKCPLAPDEAGAGRKKTSSSLNGRIKPSPTIATNPTDANQPFAIAKKDGVIVVGGVAPRESVISDISSSRPNSTASEGCDFSDIEDDDEEDEVEEDKDDDETTTEYSESCRDDDDDGPSSEEEEQEEVGGKGCEAVRTAALDPISEETSLANKTSDDGY